MNSEMARVLREARQEGVTVDGWQEGTGGLSGFAMVTDKTTRTTFGVGSGEPLADALGRAQARMAAGREAAGHRAMLELERIRADEESTSQRSGKAAEHDIANTCR